MIKNPIITPTIPSIPSVAPFSVESLTAAVVLNIIAAFLVVGLAVFLGWILYRVLISKNMVTNLPLNLILSGVAGLGLFLRFGLSVTMLQGLFLFFVLFFASMSDLTDHTVSDAVWLIVVALALWSIPSQGLGLMTLGAAIVFLPQMIMALIDPQKAMGGADIKLSTALAFLLGAWRGVGAYFAGLLLAVIVMSIYNHKHRNQEKKPFALVPFLSIGAMIAFFI